jgi:hypothetical protein
LQQLEGGRRAGRETEIQLHLPIRNGWPAHHDDRRNIGGGADGFGRPPIQRKLVVHDAAHVEVVIGRLRRVERETGCGRRVRGYERPYFGIADGDVIEIPADAGTGLVKIAAEAYFIVEPELHDSTSERRERKPGERRFALAAASSLSKCPPANASVG